MIDPCHELAKGPRRQCYDVVNKSCGGCAGGTRCQSKQAGGKYGCDQQGQYRAKLLEYRRWDISVYCSFGHFSMKINRPPLADDIARSHSDHCDQQGP